MHNSLTEPKLVPVSSVIGEVVKNYQGEELGEVKDIVIDLENSRVAYAVLSFGGFLRLGKKLFLVPWNALSFCEDEGFCIDIPRSTVEHAPGFDPDQWPDVSDQRWGAELHRFYNVAPYWETTPSRSGTDNVPKPHTRRTASRES